MNKLFLFSENEKTYRGKPEIFYIPIVTLNQFIEKSVYGSSFIRSYFFFSDEPRIRSGTWEEPTCEHRVVPTIGHARTLQHTVSQRSSEDSYCSGSEPELSSDEESDRSAASSNR